MSNRCYKNIISKLNGHASDFFDGRVGVCISCNINVFT